MTTISSSTQQVRHHSPLAKLQQTLASEISSGKINSADQSALTSALESIDSSMQSAMTSGTKPSPEEGKAKVQSLISDMVSNGTLTSDQASELQQVFDDTFSGGPGGAKGKMGPPPPPPEGASDADSDDSSSGSMSLTLTGSSSDISTLLKKLLEGLASNGTSTYSSSATSSSNVSSLFLDKTA